MEGSTRNERIAALISFVAMGGREAIKKNWPLFACTAVVVVTMLWCTEQITTNLDYVVIELLGVKDAVDEVSRAITYQ